MKFILAFAFCVFTLVTKGQDTIFYNNNWERISALNEASYYSVITHDPSDTNKAMDITYYKSGQKKIESYYSEFTKSKRDGHSKSWTRDGVLLSDIEYKNGKFNGKLLTFWEDGTPKRNDTFVNDSLIYGACYNVHGKAIPHFDYEVMPEYPGGVEKLMRYLFKEIKYPNEARKNNIEGSVRVKFIVNKDGSISDVRILKSVDPELDAEAIRVVKSMDNWSPGMQDGEPVRVAYVLPIKFALK